LKKTFISPFFYLPLTKNISFFIFFENKFIHPDEIGCWQYAIIRTCMYLFYYIPIEQRIFLAS